MPHPSTIRDLEPKVLWNHFADLNAVPRPSKKEERIIGFMKEFGERLGLPTVVDASGNVVIKKPATNGMEERPVVILQSHLDMVHQKNAGTQFDFEKEGIRAFIDGEWVKAEGTTLGADNGVGVAAIMALLSSSEVSHPPLEALFTIDEETGMTGAKGLDESLLDGKILLNLDSEEDDELTIGCAGGIDTNTLLAYRQIKPEGDVQAWKVTINGLKGGHSGIDIHLGRGNANKLIARLLYRMDETHQMSLSTLDGGSLRNAIPRESSALVVVPRGQSASFQTQCKRRIDEIFNEFKTIEPDLEISIVESDELPLHVMHPEDQKKAINAIYAVPNGVFRMSPDIPGLVETSSSLARVIIKEGNFITQSLQRSSLESGKADIANAVRATFELIGATVENDGDYPGWAPNADSEVLKVMESLYENLFGSRPKVSACHAGLECGIISEHYPGLDMVSFGPTIKHPHSPDEKVHIPSVQKFWSYLTHTLESLS